MLLGRVHFLDAAGQELDDMMLQSPLTSTPFSVKDILKLEQQQQSGSLELQHRVHTQQHLTGSPPQQQHFQTPPSCMLAGPRDSPSFSDGEDNLVYLSALAVREEDRGDTNLSPDMYVHPALQGAKLEAAELEEQENSELMHCKGRTKGNKGHAKDNEIIPKIRAEETVQRSNINVRSYFKC